VDQIIDFLTSKTLAEMAADPRVLFGTAVVFVLAVLFRWKYVLLFLFAIGATMAVLKYTAGGEGSSEIVVDQGMMLFIGGTIVIAIVLIYFLFIRD
jgi:ABC-type glycerol-3-phosphate transport system permease component